MGIITKNGGYVVIIIDGVGGDTDRIDIDFNDLSVIKLPLYLLKFNIIEQV